MGLRRPVRTILIVFVLTAVTLGAGYLGGGVLADRVNQNRAWDDRRGKTEAVLRSMDSDLKVGWHLPDHTFEDRQGEPVSLAAAVSQPTLLVFAEPDCHGCVRELDNLRETAGAPSARVRIMVVTNYLPTEFERTVEGFDRYRYFLYDRANAFTEQLGVFTFPFNILVGPDLKVLAIDAGVLDEPTFERVLDEVR